MAATKLNQRLALGFAAALVLLQTGRAVLWWRPPTVLSDWFYLMDAYLVAAFLLAGAAVSKRSAMFGRLIIAAGWGFSCGILSRSFFQQLADPARHSGPEFLVLVCKGALLVMSVVGLATAMWCGKDKEDSARA